jgi:hypothetical protein
MRYLAPLLLLSGCAGVATNAPSLLPRAIESRSDAEPAVTPDTVQPDPALDRQIAERIAAFDAAVRAFAENETSTEAIVASAAGAPQGSDAWLNAQTALSLLGNARAATDTATADLEALAIARAENGANAYPALDAALARSEAEAKRENEVTTRLSLRLEN